MCVHACLSKNVCMSAHLRYQCATIVHACRCVACMACREPAPAQGTALLLRSPAGHMRTSSQSMHDQNTINAHSNTMHDKNTAQQQQSTHEEEDADRADEAPHKAVAHVAVGVLGGGGAAGLQHAHAQQGLRQLQRQLQPISQHSVV